MTLLKIARANIVTYFATLITIILKYKLNTSRFRLLSQIIVTGSNLIRLYHTDLLYCINTENDCIICNLKPQGKSLQFDICIGSLYILKG